MSNCLRYPKGSEWRKWDLHFHTPSSFDYEDKSVTNQNIIDELFKNEISVVAITDHHFIDVERISELQKLGKDKITVLPGIELRSELGGSESVHFIGIFPEKCDLESIWISIQGMCKLTPNDIKSKGDDNIFCDFKDTAKLIHELNGIVSVHAGNKSNTIESISNALNYKMAVKTDLVENIDIYEIGTVKDQEGYIEKVFPNVGKCIPMIICSDNHNIKKYSVKQLCWIKADPLFYGLKQIIYEPFARVRLQDDIPENKIDYLVIDKVRYIDESQNNLFSNEWIELNGNLNSIIGGKSSGKSMLLYHIAKTIDPLQVEGRIKNLIIPSYKFDSDTDFDFEVKWKDEVAYKLNNSIEEKNRKITYIPQMYINNLAEKDAEQSLNNLILDVLTQNQDFKMFYEEKIDTRGVKNNNVATSIISMFDLVEKLNTQKEELKKLGDKKAINNEITKVNLTIEDLKNKSDMSNEEKDKYTELDTKKITEEKNLGKLERIKNGIEAFKSFVQEIPEQLDKKIDILVEDLANTIDEENIIILEKLRDDIKKSFKENVLKILTDKFSILKELDEKIEISKKLLEAINNQLFPFTNKFSNKKLLNELQIKIEEQRILVKALEEKEKSINAVEEKIKRTENDMMNYYEGVYKIYKDIESELKKDTFKKISDDIELKVNISFDSNKFADQFETMVDKRLGIESDLPFWGEDNHYVYDENNHKKNIRSILKIILRNDSKNFRLKTGVIPSDAVVKLMKDYYTIKFDLIHNGDTIVDMSPGKRGLVLLKLYLHLSNINDPILIDQPEDNLDNRTIYKELNDFIKEKKIRRQIIMVSHNANLVVSTDSENIIVANQDGQQAGLENRQYRFEYVSGSLECQFDNPNEKGILYQKGIREHVCEILEGGKEAFEKREKKYGFNNK